MQNFKTENIRNVLLLSHTGTGKTSLALHILANAQKKGGNVAFIDAEHALDPDYAKKIGELDKRKGDSVEAQRWYSMASDAGVAPRGSFDVDHARSSTARKLYRSTSRIWKRSRTGLPVIVAMASGFPLHE